MLSDTNNKSIPYCEIVAILGAVLGFGFKWVVNPKNILINYTEARFGITGPTCTDAPGNYGWFFAFPVQSPNHPENLNGFVVWFATDAGEMYVNTTWQGSYATWRKIALTVVNN